MTTSMMPVRPRMPTPESQARSEYQATRLSILMEDWDDVVNEWVRVHIGAERAATWGIPDTSANPLADLSRQLSTPGLYGYRNTITHAGDESAEALAGPQGLLDDAGYFATMPFVQYITLGLGDMLIRWDAPQGLEGMTMRLVWPHNVHLVESTTQPGVAEQLWELRLRHLLPEGQYVYTWDIYDISDPENPTFRVMRARQDGSAGDDMSQRFDIEGYPWLDSNGRGVLPFSHYKDQGTGQLWNVNSKRGAHRGTLNTALYWTYAGHCARDATGSYVIVAGLNDASGVMYQADNSASQNPTTGSPPVRTKLVTPGAIDYHTVQEGVNPFVSQIGPGANLGDIRDFADAYEMRQATRFGLNPSDLTRNSSNPHSAAALMVSNEGKREFSKQAEEPFRRADLQTLKVAAIVARVGDLGEFPEDGYSVQYKTIPRTSAEQAQLREQLQWEFDHGLISEIDMYVQLHPGSTRDDAIAAIRRAKEDQAELADDVDETDDVNNEQSPEEGVNTEQGDDNDA